MLFNASVARLAARSCQKLNKPLIMFTIQMAIPNSSVPLIMAIAPEIQSRIAIVLIKFLKNVFHCDFSSDFLIALGPYFFNLLAASSELRPLAEECKLVKTFVMSSPA